MTSFCALLLQPPGFDSHRGFEFLLHAIFPFFSIFDIFFEQEKAYFTIERIPFFLEIGLEIFLRTFFSCEYCIFNPNLTRLI